MSLSYEDSVKELQRTINITNSTATSYDLWLAEFHSPMFISNSEYEATFTDTVYMINEFFKHNPVKPTVKAHSSDLARHIIYMLSTATLDTISMATIASQLEVRHPDIDDDFGKRLTILSELVMSLKSAGILDYAVTAEGHPLVLPMVTVDETLAATLAAKFKAPIPQIEGTMGSLNSDEGLLEGLAFSGKSTKRKTPMNIRNMEFAELVSHQVYKVDLALANGLDYFVPTVTDTGEILSEEEREAARQSYYRFIQAAETAAELDLGVCFPTSLDSRNRAYNMATIPAIRLCLRAPEPTGSLTPFEQQLIKE